jgi:uncharacterized BrkB/YihY/UPF0761 family membrane protein
MKITRNALGLASLLVVSCFWLALLVPRIWRPVFPGAGLVVIAALVLSLTFSVLAASFGSPRWYFATVAALGTLLFVGLRMH